MTRPHFPLAALLAAGVAASALAACTVGPNYARPAALPAAQTVPIAFKEAQGWKAATPMDAIDRTGWWSVFNDPVLDALERRVAVTNQNVAAAEAAYRQARGLVAENTSSFFPTLSADAGVTYTRTGPSAGSVVSGGTVISSGTTDASGTTTGTTTGATVVNKATARETTRGNLALNASWAPDVWGRIRRTVESSRDAAQASAGDLANATLSAQGQLAAFYFQLRALDEQKRLLTATVTAYQRAQQLTQNQYNAGVVARSDVIQATSQVQTAQAQLVDLDSQRGAREHAIAMLIGVAPADLTIAQGVLPTIVPVAPAGLPSALLERRPDIAAAERSVASANASVGVAISAYYPNFTLTGSGTSSSTSFSKLISLDNFVWSLGPSVAETLIDFGARKARVQEARARYDQTVANYRQTVLAAFQGVEDQLVALRVLEQEQSLRAQAQASALQAEQIALNQYRAGQVTYTTVITAQTQSLSAQQSSLTVLGNRLNASVQLIQALGGGWSVADLPRG